MHQKKNQTDGIRKIFIFNLGGGTIMEITSSIDG